MLLSTSQIAEKYNVSSYTVTQNWVANGLKHIKGAKNSFLYKVEWVDEFLEQLAFLNIKNKTQNNIPKNKRHLVKNCVYQVH